MALWGPAAGDNEAYVVTSDGIEAWPKARSLAGCA
jgi:hypothetical protein